MRNNTGLEQLPDSNGHSSIPSEHLLSAMAQIAFDLEGEQLYRTVTTLNETSGSNFPNAEAVTLLADKDPNALENVLTLAEEMYDDVLALRKKEARREKLSGCFHAVGRFAVKFLGAGSPYGNNMFIPPEMGK